jgi:hypothetical protein
MQSRAQLQDSVALATEKEIVTSGNLWIGGSQKHFCQSFRPVHVSLVKWITVAQHQSKFFMTVLSFTSSSDTILLSHTTGKSLHGVDIRNYFVRLHGKDSSPLSRALGNRQTSSAGKVSAYTLRVPSATHVACAFAQNKRLRRTCSKLHYFIKTLTEAEMTTLRHLAA